MLSTSILPCSLVLSAAFHGSYAPARQIDTKISLVVSDKPLSEEERVAVAISDHAEVQRRVRALGWHVWEGEGYLAAVAPGVLQLEERRSYLEALGFLAEGDHGVRAFSALPPGLQAIVRRELESVGAPENRSLTPADGTKVEFEPFGTVELTDGSRTVRVPVFAPRKPGQFDSLFASPPGVREAKNERTDHLHYPRPWYAPRASHYVFSPTADDMALQAEALAWFWKRMAEYEADWSERTRIARDKAFSALAKDWTLGSELGEIAGMSARDLPPALGAVVREFLLTNHAARGFSGADDSSLFLANARVTKSERKVCLVYGSSPSGGRAIGMHILP